MKTFRIIILCLISASALPSHAQVYEIGLGGLKPSGFPYGINLHAFGGYKLTKHFTLGLSLGFSKLKNTHSDYPMLIDYGSWERVKIEPDTFYDVHERNGYAFAEFALEPRFYSTKETSRFFFCPSIGIGFFQQTNHFTKVGPDYEESGKFNALNPSFGIELAKEYPLKASKNLFIQFDFSSKIYFGFRATDIYLAPFTLSKIILKGRFGLVYRV